MPDFGPQWIGPQQSKLRGISCIGSVIKSGDTRRRQICDTHAYESFDCHDAPEQERQLGSQDGEDDEESQEQGPWSLAAVL